MTAKFLAETHMEYIKKSDFSTTYTLTNPPGYDGYTANYTAVPFYNDNIQKITITILHESQEVFSLEGYKTKRREA